MMQIPRTLANKNKEETDSPREICDSLRNGHNKKTKQIKKMETTPTIRNFF